MIMAGPSSIFQVAGRAMSAQLVRMNTTASNLANVGAISGSEADAYRTMKPVFHISGKYPARRGCCALVAPVADHPSNKNEVIVYDLREDPSELIAASAALQSMRLMSNAVEGGGKGGA